MSAFPVRSLAFSGFRAGSLSSVVFRGSARSFTGFVLELRFKNYDRACGFARLWSARLGLSVRLSPHFGLWSVVVPCLWASSRVPRVYGRAIAVCGGVRGLVRVLSDSGLV